MARKQPGGLNRLLNFIGLVDDENTRDTYGEEYQNGNYGRQAAYVPSRQPAGRAQARTPQRRSLPEPRSGRYDGRAERRTGRAGYDDYGASTRRFSSRFADDGYGGGYGDGYAPRSERVSRFAETPERPRERERRPSANLPQPRPRVSPRSRTVMYSLRSLEDCCEVIDQLIANNTVVLTMDELDGRLMQRAVDTLSGAVFALHASIRKASDKTYLVAPMSVEVNDAYDVERGFR